MITTAKLINSALALVLTVVLAVPTKIGLDLLVWIGEAQLHFIRADAEGPATLFNFAAKISLWLTDFIKVWVVAFCQATGPIFISFWLFNKWNRKVSWPLVCIFYAVPHAGLLFWLVADQTLALFAAGSFLVYVAIAFAFIKYKHFPKEISN